MHLKIEAFSGVSGDMMLGALVDLAGGGDKLERLPQLLGLEGAAVTVGRVKKCGIACTKVTIVDDTEPVHRHLSHIEAIIDGAELPAAAKDLARRIFRILGEAEAAAHETTIEKVHFHEVGAIDSILDIVGAAWLLSELGVDGVLCSSIVTGSGFVQCAHGRMPVPAPATERILHGVPSEPGPVAKEMTTPTGAAIVKALAPRFEMPRHTAVRSGYGAGDRDLEQPNCLRLSLVDVHDAADDGIWVLQANLDDISGELLGEHLQGRLFEAGALDVTVAPLLMKKGRPGHRLELLCPAAARESLTAMMLEETTTIGVRCFAVERTVLPRTIETVATPLGEVRLKVVTLPSGGVRKTPEYQDCVRCAEAGDVSLQRVMEFVRGLVD